MSKKKDDNNRTFEEESFDLSKPLDETPEEVSDLLKPLEKYKDFVLNNPWRVILYSFLAALVLFVVSLLLHNIVAAGCLIILYPTSLGLYGIALTAHKHALKWHPNRRKVILDRNINYTVMLWTLSVVIFLLDLIF